MRPILSRFTSVVPQTGLEEDCSPPAGHERSARADLLDAFLRKSHGRLGGLSDVHRDALARDPIFYGHLSRWYMERGCIRDHQEMFVAHLLASPFDFHRVHARSLMQALRVYQVARVVKYSKETLHGPSRPLRRAVEAYLRRREQQPAWFDECAIRDRHSLKQLYASLHLRPSERAEQILFAEAPPADSRAHVARTLPKLAHDPSAQARLIVEHHIHYTTAVGAIKHYTPSVLFALASVMTAPQIITNLAFLQKHGALQHAETRQLLDARIKEAVRDARVSDFKAIVALRNVGYDVEIAGSLLRTTQERLRNRGSIRCPTAIFVDKSGSMEVAVELGKLLAILCSAVAESDLHVFAFDTAAFPIRPATRDIAGWEKAFRPIFADGGTSIGVPFRLMKQTRVEQIVVITDGEENVDPRFRNELDEYERCHGVRCRVIVVKLLAHDSVTPLERDLADREVTVIPFRGDYYNLPNVVPLLCSTPIELVDEVLATPLYTLDDRLPPGYDEARHEIL